MSDSELVYRDAERRTPGSEAISRRIAKLCELKKGTKVLDVGCGAGPTARLLARELGCKVTCIDVDPKAIESLKAAAKADGVDGLITAIEGDVRSAKLPEGGFEAVIAEGSVRFLGATFGEAVGALRRFLQPNGRVALSTAARVGRVMPEAVSRFYAERDEQLLQPRELAQAMEKAGFEPLAVDAFADALLDEHYRTLEQALSRLSGEGERLAQLRREIDVFRHEGGRAAVNVVLIVARRKEPGERPPASRGGE